jgi:prophage antirepressor-like protein
LPNFVSWVSFSKFQGTVVGLSNVSQAVSRLDDDQKDNSTQNDVVGREKRMVGIEVC